MIRSSMWLRVPVAALCGVLLAPAAAQPVGSALTYQAELRASGQPAAGPVDLRFRLYDAVAAGGQVGSTIDRANVALAQGRFTQDLDFGAAAFGPDARFLEIDVRSPAGSGAYVTLVPRQRVTPSPVAQFAVQAGNAATAASATQLNGQSASFYQNAANLSSGTIPDARLAGAYTGALTLSNAGNGFTGVFTGNGTGLIGLSASNLASGTLADARLSNNVALLNAAQTFSAGKTFSAAPAFTAIGSPFSVASSALVTNLNADLLDGLSASAFLTGIPVPLTVIGSVDGDTVYGQNASPLTNSSAIHGVSTATSGSTLGGRFESNSTNGAGVYGAALASTGSAVGGRFVSTSTSGTGVSGWANAATGVTHGGVFTSDSTDGRGVLGQATAGSGVTYGVFGQNNGTGGFGVYGIATAGSGTTYGVSGSSGSTSGRGVHGAATAATGSTYGVYGLNASNSGVALFGDATSTTGVNYGVYARTPSPDGRAILGWATAGSGPTFGVIGASDSTSGVGVQGRAGTASGWTSFNAPAGVWGDAASGNGVLGTGAGGTGVAGLSTSGSGVYGESNSTTGGNGVIGIGHAGTGVAGLSASGIGVYAASQSNHGVQGLTSTAGSNLAGVHGRSENTSGSGMGVYGLSAGSSGVGVFGMAAPGTASAYGVLGFGLGGAWSVFANGALGASGGKAFRIDHPDDPENRYLLHYSAESPEIINFYRGSVLLDGAGTAVVELPHYFAKINKDPSYVLTAVGAAMPMLHIAQEIDVAALIAGAAAEPGEAAPLCSFRIAGGAPGGKVSWRVEAIRNDRWVRSHGAPVEVEKQNLEKGTYQRPEFYGQPPEKGMHSDAEGEHRHDGDRAHERPALALRSPGQGR